MAYVLSKFILAEWLD